MAAFATDITNDAEFPCHMGAFVTDIVDDAEILQVVRRSRKPKQEFVCFASIQSQ
jgi:hypothetical protein